MFYSFAALFSEGSYYFRRNYEEKGKRNFERLIVVLLALVICMSNISFDAMATESKTSAKEETLKSEKSVVEPEKQEAPKSEKSASESKNRK